MERLTFDGDFCDIAMCLGEYRMTSECADGPCSRRKVWERLKEYEDTGITPERIVELQKQVGLLSQYVAQKFEASMDDFREINGLKLNIQSLEQSLRVACDGLEKFTKAEREGRLVLLDEPRLPLIWGDEDHETILCPNCNRDLMGGFELADAYGPEMFQCPHCGQPVDATKVPEEYDAADKNVGHTIPVNDLYDEEGGVIR